MTENITAIDEVPDALIQASSEATSFSSDCLALSRKWAVEAAFFEYTYMLVGSLVAISSTVIAVFAVPNATIGWVKIVAFVGAIGALLTGFAQLKASATRQAHVTLSIMLVRYRLGKTDLSGLLVAWEQSTQQYREWLPRKSNTAAPKPQEFK